MISVVFWSLSLAALPPRGTEAMSSAVLRANDDERPQRRSREDGNGAPRIQMGVGPTALAMLALVAALVGRSLRRRRADSVT